MRKTQSLFAPAATAALILAAGCGAGQVPGGHVPNEAIGKWQLSSVPGVTYTDGGAFAAPSGTVVEMDFDASGHYTFIDFQQSSLYQCTMTVLGRETGGVDFHGDSFTLSPAEATLTSKDTCNAAHNWKKTWQNRLDGPKGYTWALQADPYVTGATDMVVTFPDGSQFPLRAR